MGGIGSGNWYRWDRKTTTGEIKSLDIRQLVREGLLEPGKRFGWSWYSDGEKTGYIDIASGHNQITLNYRIREYDDEWEDVNETIKITHTACNLGGSRPWFICPVIGCGQRVAFVYGAGKYFACRHCYDLAYGSQQEDRHSRLQRKIRKLRNKLGAEPYGDDLPKRPKGMHHRTYQQLMWKYHFYNEKVWRSFERLTAKL